MPSREKLIDALVRLIRGTQEGRIRWTIEKTIDGVKYVTDYKSRRLRLYSIRRIDHWDAQEEAYLEIIDDAGTSLWIFPRVSGLDDLLGSVRYQTAAVKGLLDEIIEDPELELESTSVSSSG